MLSRRRKNDAKSRRAERAGALVAPEIAKWRAVPYAELIESEGAAVHVSVENPDGSVWVLETQVFWDDKRRKTIRVIVDAKSSWLA